MNVRLMAIVALGLVASATNAFAQASARDIMAPLDRKMCVGNIGTQTPFRIFVRPVMVGNVPYVDVWGDFVSNHPGKEQWMEPGTAYRYGGRYEVRNTRTPNLVTFLTNSGATYEVSVIGQAIIGDATGSQGFHYKPNLPCHESTTTVAGG